MPPRSIPVLLIEDNPGDARLIQEMLAEAGDVRFEMTTVGELRAGLEALDEGGFGVVLLDLSLPDSHGLETFRRLRRDTVAVPVVVLTGLDDAAVARQAVEEGAQDYLVKNRVTAAHLAHALRFSLSRHQARVALERAHRANEYELRVAREVWQRLFPPAPPDAPGLDIHGATYPAVLTGGDFFDYLPLEGGQLGVVLGDVTSHGVGPALLMATARAYLRAFSRMTDDVSQVLSRTNDLLIGDVTGHNVTLLLARLCPRARTLQHTSAGHWPGYVLDGHGEVRHELLSTDVALGVLADATYPPAPAVQLRPGDLVLLITDGVLEARGSRGLFGRQRALELVRQHRHESARQLVERLYEEVRRWEGDRPQGDDVSAVVIKVLDEAH